MVGVRKLDMPRGVLVHVDGWWTGRLLAWERWPDGWRGRVTWRADVVRHEEVVPAELLRPFEEQRAEVWSEMEQAWLPGWLHGWRRRPGGYGWEGEASTDRLYPYWYPAQRLRRPTSLTVRRDTTDIY